GKAPWMKVGLELFTREGPMVVKTLKRMGFQVMLDLKLFDIPNTVRGGVRAASWIGTDLITIHLLGGERMCRAALEERDSLEHKPMIFGVTVLTSLEQGELPVQADLQHLTGELAGKAAHWGLDGVVCSGLDISGIKAAHPALRCLTPGIRPAGSSDDDQRRVVTPAEAVALGADFLVVGRPITQAKNPVAAAAAILGEMI
ncbi:MAG: orotidine-5'-phosphate decarboxylase, partial [Deltaproteobacteria bacterium]|nr:orotidine-5'-phosphate decarboxylase [Deltaproteobacteria bacterium]